jgi:hypothetical protein
MRSWLRRIPDACGVANLRNLMHLRTILCPGFPLSLTERVERFKDWLVMELAWRLPRSVVYWTVIRGTAAAAGDFRSPTEITAVEVIEHYSPDD